MELLVTGGAGFIGSNLVALAVKRGHSVRVIDDLSTGNAKNLENIDVDFYEGSILNETILRKAVQGVDSIMHLAAVPSVPRSIDNPTASHDANATGTLKVLEEARRSGIAHVTMASSSSVYGANPHLPKQETDYTRPMSPYAASKQAAESYTIAYNFSYGMSTVVFRFFNVYGPGQAVDHDYAAVVPRFLDAALYDRPAVIHGDGEQSRDFTFVDTVCEVLLESALRKISETEPINLAFQTNTSLLELLTLMEETLGKNIKREHIEPRVGDVRASQADCSRLSSLFPKIRPLPLREGIGRTASWMEHAANES